MTAFPCYRLGIANQRLGERTMSYPTAVNKESHYVITLRSEVCPAVAANVFRRSAPDGGTYLDFEISRSWKSGDRQGYSSRFFVQNREGLKEVVDMACDWIERNPQAADGPLSPADDGQPRFGTEPPSKRQ